MKTAVIMNDNSYAGREYLQALRMQGIKADIVSIGNYPEINELEEKRCGGLWKPVSMETLRKTFTVFEFVSLNESSLIDFLKEKKYDVGIQGGTGILKENIINKFKSGILNFHPGDLPKYRGCSA
ncbi:MAG: formyltransferase family protein, partial [Bacteroidales bacterium]|nr:formyltransferase family protein [Bacteroidales bacterium]